VRAGGTSLFPRPSPPVRFADEGGGESWGNLPVPPDPLHRSASRTKRFALGRTATGAVPRLENGWVFGPWGFDSLSFRSFGGMAELERQRVASA
jgi:hypothetical protein